ncbi:unnamed protein product [Notodromas monacha]|uniref:Uncharacterized protein n=1 Tax=Notodromas monacha TaxID=399045 RepID=A0A7R9BN77_9CRUS|nr:unnamed protein product [Notodromas monacha]CAG0918288.1 unnamed protein product [Notodromas monacha]
MDAKGEQEEVTYPNIFFMVDNFDEVFSDLDVRDGEMICAELMASDKDGSSVGGVAFLGAIGYDTLKRVYEARTSATNRMAHRMKNFSLFQSRPGQRMEFMKMKGPGGKGHAEMAVTKAPGKFIFGVHHKSCKSPNIFNSGRMFRCGADTPSSEPGMSFTDLYDSDFEDEDDEQQSFRQRRMSDPSSTLNNFVRSWKSRPSVKSGTGGNYVHDPSGTRKKSHSESEGLDQYSAGYCEVEAGDPRDDLDGTDHIPLWSMKGALQTYHFWKESRRLQSSPLNTYLTYVSLPWFALIRGENDWLY